MNLGFRVFDDSYIDKFNLDLVQISVWHKTEDDFKRVKQLAEKLKKQKRRFVVHPFSLYLSETRPEVRKHYLTSLKKYAQITDLGLIVHDETFADESRGRLVGEWADAYTSALSRLEQICPVSIENACNSPDALWFWQNFASNSITFDIGHFVAAGVDCFEFIDNLPQEIIHKIDFIHLHHNNGKKEIGITDHWPLVDGCVELRVLERLLKFKPEVMVVLEIEGEGIAKSLNNLALLLKR